jgi:arylsulfatase A
MISAHMNIASNVIKIAVLFAYVALIASHNVYAAQTAAGPNIVIILADDLGWGSVRCYGGVRLETPNIDRLAKEGRMFRHAYAPGSVCSPTRYALMTGRYYWRTSIKDGKVLPANRPLHIETNRVTIASLTKRQGYRTAAIGKWHLGLGSAATVDWNAPLQPGPRSMGFDYFFGLAANPGNQPNAYIENEQLVGRIPGESVTLDGAGKAGKTFGIKSQRVPEEIMGKLTAKAVEWVEENRATPFLLYFAPNAVHEPVKPAAKFTDSPFGRYGDFIHELDWSVGRILETLDKLKLTESTLVVFTSDNGGVVNPGNTNAGAAMKAGLAINGPLRGGKHTVYEGGFRVPFLVRWPGKVTAGTASDDIVCISDILATLAGMFKTRVPSGNGEDSLDVTASWFGKGKPRRDFVILQDASAIYAIRQGPWKLIERENGPSFEPRNRRAAQARKPASAKDELYNLEADPVESKDVAREHPKIVERLRKLLAKTRDQPD